MREPDEPCPLCDELCPPRTIGVHLITAHGIERFAPCSVCGHYPDPVPGHMNEYMIVGDHWRDLLFNNPDALALHVTTMAMRAL